jgi:hypothetical protein
MKSIYLEDFKYGKEPCLLVGGSARARHEERWTCTKKQRLSSTSLRVKRAAVEFWSDFFSLNNPSLERLSVLKFPFRVRTP